MRTYFLVPTLIIIGFSIVGCTVNTDLLSSETSVSSYGNSTPYVNDEYGFSFTPFAEWEGYKVMEETHADNSKNYIASFTFGLPIEHSSSGVTFGGFMRIDIATHNQWSRWLEDKNLLLPAYLGENPQYVFVC